MSALEAMLVDAERLVSRCELRLEQYRLHCLSGGRNDAAALNELARMEEAFLRLKALHKEILKDIETERQISTAV